MKREIWMACSSLVLCVGGFVFPTPKTTTTTTTRQFAGYSMSDYDNQYQQQNNNNNNQWSSWNSNEQQQQSWPPPPPPPPQMDSNQQVYPQDQQQQQQRPSWNKRPPHYQQQEEPYPQQQESYAPQDNSWGQQQQNPPQNNANFGYNDGMNQQEYSNNDNFEQQQQPFHFARDDQQDQYSQQYNTAFRDPYGQYPSAPQPSNLALARYDDGSQKNVEVLRGDEGGFGMIDRMMDQMMRDDFFGFGRMMDSMMSPFMREAGSMMAATFKDQQQTTGALLEDARECLLADIAATNALGDSIRLGTPFSRALSSTNVNGVRKSRVELGVPVNGNRGTGVARIMATEEGIARLEVETGGRIINVYCENLGAYSGPRRGAIDADVIVENEPY